MKTNLLKSIFISLILLVGATNAWANGGIGYKGVKFTKDGTTTGWYNIHNVTWDYVHDSYECRSGKSGVTDFNNADLGIVTSLKLHSFVVIGWTDNSDWVSGQLKYRTYLQSASAGNYNVYNVGNYETYCNVVDVLATCGNNRVVGKNGGMNVTLVDNNTTPGKYYLQLQGMGRMRYCNGDFNTNDGSEVKASYTVPGFAKTTASQAFGSVGVGSNISKTISFTNHYGTKLTTSNCVLSGTNKSEFSVTSISETGVTVKFTPSSSGSKSATLTITDAHSKKCTITLSGTATPPTYTVTFNANGHGTAPAAQTVTQGSKATQPTAPTATGYTFGGWYKEAGCTNAFDFNTAITANITLYAKWTEKPKYTVTISSDGNGTVTPNTPQQVGEIPVSITATPNDGYKFKNWTKTGNVTIADANSSSTTITATGTGTVTANFEQGRRIYLKPAGDNKWAEGNARFAMYVIDDEKWYNMTKMDDGDSDAGNDIYYCDIQPTNEKIIFCRMNPSGVNNWDNNNVWTQTDDLTIENECNLFDIDAEEMGQEYPSVKTGKWMQYNAWHLTGAFNDWELCGQTFDPQNDGSFIFTQHLGPGTYEFKLVHNGEWYGNTGTMTFDSSTGWTMSKTDNCKINVTIAGEYIFTIDLSQQGKVLLSVEYPVQVGDYRVIYKDNAKWSNPIQAHSNTWYHPSRIIKKNKTSEPTKDIVSFFISVGNNPTMQFQRAKSITNGNVTWENAGDITIPTDITEAGVYNFIATQAADGKNISMEENAEPYTGNYYIRCDVFDGGWDNYKTNSDNRIIYSAFSESDANSFGDKFSHYATKYCTNGKNIKFTIANDYSPCISDTLARDILSNGTVNPFGNLTAEGTLNSGDTYNANIRFMWNRKTNKISRAYIGAASANNYLVLKANGEIRQDNGTALSTDKGDVPGENKAKFKDTQNWIYERTIRVKPETRVRVYACYPSDKSESAAQYFNGKYNATWNDANSTKIMSGTSNEWYTIRVIYDFKTNRLMTAWVPSGQIDEQEIDVDLMIIRDHQEPATCITFQDTDGDNQSGLTEVKMVYGTLRFNRWILNNRANDTDTDPDHCGGPNTYDENTTNHHHPKLSEAAEKSIYERALYFISFPFDVHLSDVFGFGTYGTHWVISEYNGKRRAERGYFADNCVNEDCTNWDYIWRPDTFTMKANTGYLLSLDLDLMKYNNLDFWAHNISTVELYFPSTATVGTIQQTDYTMPRLGEEYKCTINYGDLPGHTPEQSDRRVKDSYWRCIGVPSFANYDGSLYDTTTDSEKKYPIEWKAEGNTFPFLYLWDVSDNSLIVENTSNYTFQSTFAYLVQNGNEIHWSAVNAKPSSPIVARQRSEEQESNYEWKITLTRGEVQEDQAFIRMTNHEDVTAEFDFGQDLSKELNYGRSDIYTLIGYERAAANSMPLSDSTTVVPLGLDIEQDGDYTIAMPEGVESVGVTLLDAETGERTNLSIGMDYTISLNKGACHNRLYLEISPIQQTTTTDIEYTDQGTREQSVRKVLIDGKLYIVCDGVVYDAQGKRL